MGTGWYTGRFQPLHAGHIKCIRYILEKEDRCIVILRDTDQSERNPFGVDERRTMLEKEFYQELQDGRVIVIDSPDPDCDLTVYIGRQVGYDLIQLDAATEAISATNIRKKLYGEEDGS